MTAIRRAMPQKQQGSFYSTVIIVAIFGLVLAATLKVAPLYMDNKVVVNAMDGVIASNDIPEITVAEIRSSLARTLRVNNVDLPADAIKDVREGNKNYIVISYERRTPLFYNISAVVSFNNRFEKN